MARREIIADDLTGSDLTGQDNTAVKITFDGKTATLDLSDASKTALAEFVAGNPDSLAKLLGRTAPVRTRKTSGTRSGTSGKSGQREWLRANGYPDLGERGKFSTEMIAAWDAHTAKLNGATAGAAKPTGTIPPAPASAGASA